MFAIPRLRLTLHGVLFGVAALLLIAAALLSTGTAGAQDGEGTPEPPVVPVGPTFHPAVVLLDAEGVSVLDSGSPVSTMQTCGACHDTDFITRHSFHSDVGLSTLTTPGKAATGLPWDFGDGIFGQWNPILYRYLSPEGDAVIDLTTAEWVQVFGARHAGGGPALYGRDGELLADLDAGELTVETGVLDAGGDLTAWDWSESGTVEMNCFLCHLPDPANDARVAALQAGDFQWANTATLASTDVVTQENSTWVWNAEAFDDKGAWIAGQNLIQDPTNVNCGTCHGLVHAEAQTPLVIESCEPTQWNTITSGQIYSPQRLSDTGVNLSGKENLGRSYDIHAERVLKCTDCHYALNNPVYYREDDASQPEHLLFDPRRIGLGEYLYRPLHEFAKGSSAQGNLASEFDDTIRRCEACHDPEPNHDWLPYLDRHLDSLSCETCHVPKLYSPSRQYNDWTVLQASGRPQTACRGLDDASSTFDTFGTTLIVGFEPALLPRTDRDGSTSLAPYNLVTSWYWVYDDPARPVPYRELQAAWLDGDDYRAAVLDIFDANGDGALDTGELVIDTDAKESFIAGELAALGLDNPRIMADVRPYTISHNVADGEWAIKDCQVCHSDDSRVNASFELADRVPGGVIPVFVSNESTTLNGDLTTTEDGRLIYEPRHDQEPANLYIFGHDNVGWLDWLGVLMFLGTLVGVSGHSTLRVMSARRRTPHEPALRRTYLYTVYERQWHWLQTVAIMLLILTGLIIHKPDMFGTFDFGFVVQLHNILAAILVVNAFLALFYHLASGEIRQFLPEPRGFFGQAVAQALYYTRGIFRGEPHPMEKTQNRKMNPLQQITYLAILNVLLPAQIVTGALMWGAQTWPGTADALGGLGFLAPLHTIIAWTFATFIVAHVYLTTTSGHTPLAGIESMITGWEDVETHEGNEG